MKIPFDKIKKLAIKGFSKLKDELCLVDLENIPDGGSFEYENTIYIKMSTIKWPKEKTKAICRLADDFYSDRTVLFVETKVKPVFVLKHK